MGSSLRKKKRAKASGTTVKVGRVKKTKQTVTVKPVLLPGAKDETTWDQDRTHQLNYEHVGIVNDPNKIGKTGRNSSKLEALEEGETEAAAAKRRRDEDTSVAAQATVGGDEVRGLLGQVRSTGLAPPKRLTTKQRRIVGALVVRPNADQAPPTHPVTAAFALPSPRARHPSSFPKNVAAHPRTLEPSNPRTVSPTHASTSTYRRNTAKISSPCRATVSSTPCSTPSRSFANSWCRTWRIQISSRAAARSTSERP